MPSRTTELTRIDWAGREASARREIEELFAQMDAVDAGTAESVTVAGFRATPEGLAPSANVYVGHLSQKRKRKEEAARRKLRRRMLKLRKRM